MAVAPLSSKVQFWLYRVATIARSFKALYRLPPEQLDAFLNSYVIYDHEWADEARLIKEMGANYQQEISKRLVHYYNVLNHLCALGQVEKMYIPPAIDPSASIIANQALFEKMMCRDTGLGRGMKVLDIGCGRGRVANHIASHTGAEVTGINIDPSQLESGRRFARAKGLSHQCRFQYGDLNELPYAFADNSLDLVYEIQVIFALAKDLQKAFEEIHRILKPGGKFACLEWVVLDNYDPKNLHHANLMKGIKPLIGAIGARTLTECTKTLEKAGFKILKNENPSVDGLQASLIENADKFFTRVQRGIEFCVKCKILPAHFKTLFDRLTKDGKMLVEADRLRLLTTCHYIVAEKR